MWGTNRISKYYQQCAQFVRKTANEARVFGNSTRNRALADRHCSCDGNNLGSGHALFSSCVVWAQIVECVGRILRIGGMPQKGPYCLQTEISKESARCQPMSMATVLLAGRESLVLALRYAQTEPKQGRVRIFYFFRYLVPTLTDRKVQYR